ncbi:MAG: molybdate ABC transporter substrate-binding protein [Phycisphaeraceae bacterium]|nr:molybdate ABC transporter substrate-binding protein [Phycisphaeraceae bacterium]
MALPRLAIALVTVAFALLGCEQKPGGGTAHTSASVRIAAAADLKFALDDVIATFSAAHPAINVSVSYGSSGNFYSQLSNKAPFDLFFSADIEYPRKLIDAGHAIPDSLFDYAIGQIVIWVRNDSSVDVGSLGAQALNHPSIRKIAVANPAHAPYGRAAIAALTSLGIHDQVKDRFVFGENIAQTAQFVESGAADIGIVALSLALAPSMRDKGRFWLIPLDMYPPLEQGGVILSWAADRAAARQFASYVTAPEGRAILKSYGFMLPGE